MHSLGQAVAQTVQPGSLRHEVEDGLAGIQRARRVLQDQLDVPAVRPQRAAAVAQRRTGVTNLAAARLDEADQRAGQG